MPRARTALILLVVLLAGCSSGGGGEVSAGASSTTTAAASSAGGRAGFEAYRTCLSEHGVDLPTGGFGGGRPGGTATGTRRAQAPPAGAQGAPRTPGSLPAGVDQEAYQAAQAACASKRPADGFGGQGGAGGAGGTAFQAYASCLADHGVTVTTASTVEGQPSRPGIDRDDPDFAMANETCAALLPQGGPSTTTAS